jgi:cell division septation protein DedD
MDKSPKKADSEVAETENKNLRRRSVRPTARKEDVEEEQKVATKVKNSRSTSTETPSKAKKPSAVKPSTPTKPAAAEAAAAEPTPRRSSRIHTQTPGKGK